MNDTIILGQPAIRWEDALPTGNGHIGAMVYGATQEECILLNHERLWLPLFPRPNLPNVAPYLPEYRRLLEAHQFEQANTFWSQKLKEAGWPDLIYTNPFHPAFDLRLNQEMEPAFSKYERSLEMSTGVVTVRWDAGGVRYERQTFVSRPDNLVVVRVAASKRGMINVDMTLKAHPYLEDLRKAWHYPRRYEPGELPLQYTNAAKENYLSIAGNYGTGGGFCGLARIVNRGGELRSVGGGVSVQNSDEVLILLKIEPEKESKKTRSRLKSELEAVPASYNQLLKRHGKQHGELYGRVRLSFADEGEVTQEADRLLADAYKGQASPNLIANLFNYSRYLFISSTAEKGLPSNLQGVWNGDYIPAWSCDYTLDENVQMNHWQALPANLPELMEPYFKLFERSIPDWQANARAFYGCRGVMAPLRQSDNGLMSENMPYLIWTAGAGWIARMFYEHYLYTGDRSFLKKRAVPFLKEVALFYEDFLYEGADGKWIVCPSMSPENVPDVPEASQPTVNPTMEFAVCREVLRSLIDACNLLEIEPRSVQRWEKMLAKLPDYEVNEDGALREWLHPGLKDNYHHRHLSHIYGLFPGTEITRERTPELFEACKVAVRKRLVVGLKSQTGWSLAHMANIYARLGEGDHALECFDLIARSCLGSNLLTYHNDWRRQGITMDFGGYPPFQIDANMGVGAAVMEMLMFSLPGYLRILPALPRRWPAGKIEGIRCRGQITASIEWNIKNSIIRVRLKSDIAQKVTVAFPDWVSRISRKQTMLRSGKEKAGGLFVTIDLPANQNYDVLAE